MTKRIYQAPAGATSITVAGKTYDVDGKGRLHCDDDAAHADLLSHGYTFGDAPAPAASPAHDALAANARVLDDREAELAKREAEFTDHIVARTATLNERESELDARAADLANRETALVLAQHAVEQREAALAATAPPPPPPVEAPKGKGK